MKKKTGESFSRSLTNDLPSLQDLFEELELSDFLHGLSVRARNALHLVLDEMISNVIKYCEDGVTIQVSLLADDGALEIRLEDDGPAFNPWTAPGPPPETEPLEDIPIGGRGLQMVKEAVDSYSYRHHDGWNCVTLTVHNSN